MTVDINQPLPDEIRERMVPEWFDMTKFPDTDEKVELPDDEWRELLSEDEYRILRAEGTEPAHGNAYNNIVSEGVYVCRGCSSPVFSSVARYASGTGWPSFFAPISPDRIDVKTDHNLLMERTEVHCARCGGHFGHVFEDGPDPTGLRYCLNSLSLRFIDEASHRMIAENRRDELDFYLPLLP